MIVADPDKLAGGRRLRRRGGALSADEAAFLRRLSGVGRLVKAGDVLLEPDEAAMLDDLASRAEAA